jgi:subtilase family serine protease
LSDIRELASSITVGQAPIGTTNNPSSGISTNTTGGTSTNSTGGGTNTNTTSTAGVDLVVTAFSLSTANPSVGSAIRFNATIRNQGDTATPAGATIGIGFYVDGAVQAWWFTSSAGLAPGATMDITSNDGPNGGLWTVTSGTHTIVANIDDVNRIAEGNEGNNTRSITLNAGSSSGGTLNLADLLMMDLTTSPANPAPGQPVTFSATVKNRGLLATPANVGVGFFINGEAVSWSSPSSIGAGQTWTFMGNAGVAGPQWTAQAGTNALLAIVDILDLVGQVIETNNSKAMSLVVTAATNPVVKLAPSNGQMRITWNAKTGTVYQVCYKTALTNAAWTPLSPNITPTTTNASYTDVPPTGTGQRFYNVLVK